MSDASPIDVGTRKQLFADDHIIGERQNVFRTLNQPTKNRDNPIIELEPPQQVGGDEHVIVMGTVMYDEDERIFKMWYECADYPWSFNVIAYATSVDGVEWERPQPGDHGVSRLAREQLCFPSRQAQRDFRHLQGPDGGRGKPALQDDLQLRRRRGRGLFAGRSALDAGT